MREPCSRSHCPGEVVQVHPSACFQMRILECRSPEVHLPPGLTLRGLCTGDDDIDRVHREETASISPHLHLAKTVSLTMGLSFNGDSTPGCRVTDYLQAVEGRL